jgi:beta-phosphoglucomutase-like phosphatase (HAD superfamily)
VFLAAAKLLAEPPEACVVVEDAESGIEAGHAAGMRVIGIGPVARVAAADVSVQSLADLTLLQIRAAFRAEPV